MFYIVDAVIDSELICSSFEKLVSFVPLIHKLSDIIKKLNLKKN